MTSFRTFLVCNCRDKTNGLETLMKLILSDWWEIKRLLLHDCLKKTSTFEKPGRDCSLRLLTDVYEWKAQTRLAWSFRLIKRCLSMFKQYWFLRLLRNVVGCIFLMRLVLLESTEQLARFKWKYQKVYMLIVVFTDQKKSPLITLAVKGYAISERTQDSKSIR